MRVRAGREAANPEAARPSGKKQSASNCHGSKAATGAGKRGLPEAEVFREPVLAQRNAQLWKSCEGGDAKSRHRADSERVRPTAPHTSRGATFSTFAQGRFFSLSSTGSSIVAAKNLNPASSVLQISTFFHHERTGHSVNQAVRRRQWCRALGEISYFLLDRGNR